MEDLGYPEIAAMISTHHDLSVKKKTEITEAAVLYLADKLIQEDREVSLEERFSNSEKKVRNLEAREAQMRRYHEALYVAQQIEERLRGAVS